MSASMPFVHMKSSPSEVRRALPPVIKCVMVLGVDFRERRVILIKQCKLLMSFIVTGSYS